MSSIDDRPSAKRRNQFTDFNGTLFPSAMAFISALVEAICFIGLFQLFTSFITGNMIMIGVELADDDPQILAKLFVLPLYIAACIMWSWLYHDTPKPSPTAIRRALLAQAVFLALALVLALGFSPISKSDWLAIILVATPTVFATTLQIITLRHQIITQPHTTIMTGNIAQISITILECFYNRTASRNASEREHDSYDHKSIRHQFAIIAGFFAGGVSGGLGYFSFGFGFLIVPILILIFFASLGGISSETPSDRE
ncbi:YoaK family protein [Hoeflea sp. TYP-13]|uniref:YoaK family protein n=1 Tax=Hoeflea sp. TYP-13 TaxID=3230023 RepID=UPI0034C64491